MEITLPTTHIINFLVGVFSITAMWLSGGFILGLAEATYSPKTGPIWVLMPISHILTCFLAGFFFTKPLMANKYRSMMEPFYLKYGNLSGLLLFPALVREILLMTSTLVSLGWIMSVILDLSYLNSIILFSTLAILHVLLGGLHPVAYTDVIQVFLCFVGLYICVPVLFMNSVTSLTAFNETFQAFWVHRNIPVYTGKWIDEFLALTFGGLAYLPFYERILCATSYTQARLTGLISSVFCAMLAVPSVLVGAMAGSTDWNLTSYGWPSPYQRGEAGAVLPIVLRYLAPPHIYIIGIGAVAVSVFFSVDFALTSSASLFSTSIYKTIIHKQASEKEMKWVTRIMVLVVGLIATALTLLDSSILVFWMMGVDLSYTLVFPQILGVLFLKSSNGCGAVVGLILGAVLRCFTGEPMINLAPIIDIPGCRLDEITGNYAQYFLYRTFIVIVTVSAIFLMSNLPLQMFRNCMVSKKWNLFRIKDQEQMLRRPEGNCCEESWKIQHMRQSMGT